MTDTQLTIIVAAVPATIGAITSLVGLLVSLRNGEKTEGVKSDLAVVHDSVNGKAQQLLESVREASFAKGQKDEKDNPSK